MKLRLDLLEQLTEKDILEEAAANQHRYKPEPSFSKTGTGHLSPTSTEDSVKEVKRSTELTQKLKKRAAKSGSKSSPKS